jgi:hypothetical protein
MAARLAGTAATGPLLQQHSCMLQGLFARAVCTHCGTLLVLCARQSLRESDLLCKQAKHTIGTACCGSSHGMICSMQKITLWLVGAGWSLSCDRTCRSQPFSIMYYLASCSRTYAKLAANAIRHATTHLTWPPAGSASSDTELATQQ